jgi:hypothetical protein
MIKFWNHGHGHGHDQGHDQGQGQALPLASRARARVGPGQLNPTVVCEVKRPRTLGAWLLSLR